GTSWRYTVAVHRGGTSRRPIARVVARVTCRSAADGGARSAGANSSDAEAHGHQCGDVTRHTGPACRVPEHAAHRAANAAAHVIAKQVQRCRLRLAVRRTHSDPAARHRMTAEKSERDGGNAHEHENQRMQ